MDTRKEKLRVSKPDKLSKLCFGNPCQVVKMLTESGW